MHDKSLVVERRGSDYSDDEEFPAAKAREAAAEAAH